MIIGTNFKLQIRINLSSQIELTDISIIFLKLRNWDRMAL